MNILDRIHDYLANGGLFNPESMDHEKVSELIRDCRDHIKDQYKTIKELRDTNVMEDIVAIAPVKCKNTDPYVQRSLAGPFVWYVYNKTTGYIVAATYDRSMAEAILAGIDISNIYQDDYAITEMYRGPEPMV